MAGLVGEAMSRDAQIDQEKALATQAATRPLVIEIASQMQRLPGDDKSITEPARKHWIRQVCGAAAAVAGELPGVKRLSLHDFGWNVAVTGVVAALVIAACSIAYDGRPASPAGTASMQRVNAVQQQIPFVPASRHRTARPRCRPR